MSRRVIRMTVNGRPMEGEAEPRKLLVDFIRDDLGLTGTHIGCEHGVCGACTVMMDGEAVRSCLMFAVQAHGAELTTVEATQDQPELHALKEAFHEHHALQCGFCTPGILMSMTALLADDPDPTAAKIQIALSGNLCRCTGYRNIVRAVGAAARTIAQTRAGE